MDDSKGYLHGQRLASTLSASPPSENGSMKGTASTYQDVG